MRNCLLLSKLPTPAAPRPAVRWGLLAVLGLAIASSPHPARANQYSATFRNNYLQACQRDAQRAGLAAALATQLCQCTLTRLQEQLSEAQLRSLMQEAQRTGTSPAVLTEIGRQCAVEVLR